MKNKLFFATLSIALAVTACKKEDTYTVEDDEIAEMMAYSISANTFGISSSVEDYAEGPSDQIDCGSIIQEQGNHSAQKNRVQYSYDFTENIEKTCTPDTTVFYSLLANGNLTGPHYQSQQTIQADWVFTPASSSNHLILGGTYFRSGQWHYSRRRTFHHQVDFKLELNAIVLDRTNKSIIGGSSSFSVKGSGDRIVSYERNGSITFQENNSATITFADGREYEIDTVTGTITKTK